MLSHRLIQHRAAGETPTPAGSPVLSQGLRAVAHGPVRLRNHLRQAGLVSTFRRIRFGAKGLRAHRDYPGWVRRYDVAPQQELERLYVDGRKASCPVTFAIRVVGAESDDGRLAATMSSLDAQTYPRWTATLHDGAAESSLLAVDQGRSAAPAAGDEPVVFVATVEAGDRLAPWALHLAAAEVMADPEVELIYTDCDVVDGRGRRSAPWFKPAPNYELLLEQDFTAGLRFIRRSLLDGENAGSPLLPASAAAHDFVLRLIERPAPHRIRSIPHVLLHRSADATDLRTPDQQTLHEHAGVVLGHLRRVGTAATVQALATPTPRLSVHRELPATAPGVTAVIPTRDAPDLLRLCVDGLLAHTDYDDLRLVIADNGTTDPEALALLERVGERDDVEVVAHPGPFNYSAINNHAAMHVETPLLLLLNNDIEVIHGDWLTQMVAIALDPSVGAVGAKLLYPDGKVQHGGVTLGVRPKPSVPGVAGHTHKHAERDDPGYFGRLLHTQEVSAVTGACLLTRTSTYRSLGGLDADNLAIAFNDVDYCLRLIEAGHRVVWTPLAELYHHESVSRGYDESGPEAERFDREAAWMRQRWGDVLDRDPFYNPNLSLDRPDLTLAYPPRAPRPWSTRLGH